LHWFQLLISNGNPKKCEKYENEDKKYQGMGRGKFAGKQPNTEKENVWPKQRLVVSTTKQKTTKGNYKNSATEN